MFSRSGLTGRNGEETMGSRLYRLPGRQDLACRLRVSPTAEVEEVIWGKKEESGSR